MSDQAGGPALPPGRRVHLPDRGVTFVRELPGPAGAPTLLLVHGWLASGGLNWFRAFDALEPHFRVLAPDLRGHGRGIRSRRRLRLADCADDLAAMCEALDTGPVIPVGYSMGCPVTQLLWRRHPDLVEGLVQYAGFDRIAFGSRSRMVFGTTMAAAAGTSQVAGMVAYVPVVGARMVGPRRPYERAATLRRWAAAEMRRHDWTMLLQAGLAMSNFSSRGWLPLIDVPTAVVVTMRDRAVLPDRQLRFAARIPGATVFRADGGHVMCGQPEFGASLLEACVDVARRAGHDIRTVHAVG